MYNPYMLTSSVSFPPGDIRIQPLPHLPICTIRGNCPLLLQLSNQVRPLVCVCSDNYAYSVCVAPTKANGLSIIM